MVCYNKKYKLRMGLNQNFYEVTLWKQLGRNIHRWRWTLPGKRQTLLFRTRSRFNRQFMPPPQKQRPPWPQQRFTQTQILLLRLRLIPFNPPCKIRQRLLRCRLGGKILFWIRNERKKGWKDGVKIINKERNDHKRNKMQKEAKNEAQQIIKKCPATLPW